MRPGNENPDWIEQNKWTISKNDYWQIGMKITYADSLNRSLKHKQFIRAQKSNHAISKIQSLLLTKSGHENHIHQEYLNATDEVSICKSAQETWNIIIG